MKWINQITSAQCKLNRVEAVGGGRSLMTGESNRKVCDKRDVQDGNPVRKSTGAVMG